MSWTILAICAIINYKSERTTRILCGGIKSGSEKAISPGGIDKRSYYIADFSFGC